MSGFTDSLIDAVAAALARALAAHGIAPAAGNATVQAECARLCAEWGGDKHWLPKTWRPARDAAVRQALDAGADLTAAAKIGGVHPNTARQIARRQRSGFGRDDWVL